MREIGSEFWNVPTAEGDNSLFPQFTRWFLSGRSALKAIISQLKQEKTVALPAWCCDSMIKPFTDAGFEVRFYPVWWDHGLIQEPRTDCDVLLLMDYFGYVDRQPKSLHYSGVVIRDVTHSLFSPCPADADYCFGSLRKWCGVWTGGFAWSSHPLPEAREDCPEYEALRARAMEEKAEYLNGCPESEGTKSYLQLFSRAEELLEGCGPFKAAERDVLLARRLDKEQMIARRRENAAILMEAFPELLVFSDSSPEDCPMFVPILVPDGKRDALRQYLIHQMIYCPVHWPLSQRHRIDSRALRLYENELSLVCDQRYTPTDMERVADSVRAFWKEA